ncbi:MAG TPA: pyrroloquinoline quinone biosynthesis peptide chaperone PqqD [Steroidobacteraceae bacterium]
MNLLQTLDQRAKPRLQSGFRLQWEPQQNHHVLLFPEGMVKLNGSASEILKRCTGDATVAEITAQIEQAFGRVNLGSEVANFIGHAVERQWLTLSP